MTPEKEDVEEVVLCECHSLEHVLVMSHFTEEEMKDLVFLSIHLNKPSFLGRLKYLLGYQSRFGAFDEFIFNREKLKSIIEKL